MSFAMQNPLWLSISCCVLKPKAVERAFQNRKFGLVTLVDERSLCTTVFMIIKILIKNCSKQKLGTDHTCTIILPFRRFFPQVISIHFRLYPTDIRMIKEIMMITKITKKVLTIAAVASSLQKKSSDNYTFLLAPYTMKTNFNCYICC